jgi:hypothetical protein
MFAPAALFSILLFSYKCLADATIPTQIIDGVEHKELYVACGEELYLNASKAFDLSSATSSHRIPLDRAGVQHIKHISQEDREMKLTVYTTCPRGFDVPPNSGTNGVPCDKCLLKVLQASTNFPVNSMIGTSKAVLDHLTQSGRGDHKQQLIDIATVDKIQKLATHLNAVLPSSTRKFSFAPHEATPSQVSITSFDKTTPDAYRKWRPNSQRSFLFEKPSKDKTDSAYAFVIDIKSLDFGNTIQNLNFDIRGINSDGTEESLITNIVKTVGINPQRWSYKTSADGQLNYVPNACPLIIKHFSMLRIDLFSPQAAAEIPMERLGMPQHWQFPRGMSVDVFVVDESYTVDMSQKQGIQGLMNTDNFINRCVDIKTSNSMTLKEYIGSDYLPPTASTAAEAIYTTAVEHHRAGDGSGNRRSEFNTVFQNHPQQILVSPTTQVVSLNDMSQKDILGHVLHADSNDANSGVLLRYNQEAASAYGVELSTPCIVDPRQSQILLGSFILRGLEYGEILALFADAKQFSYDLNKLYAERDQNCLALQETLFPRAGSLKSMSTHMPKVSCGNLSEHQCSRVFAEKDNRMQNLCEYDWESHTCNMAITSEVDDTSTHERRSEESSDIVIASSYQNPFCPMPHSGERYTTNSCLCKTECIADGDDADDDAVTTCEVVDPNCNGGNVIGTCIKERYNRWLIGHTPYILREDYCQSRGSGCSFRSNWPWCYDDKYEQDDSVCQALSISDGACHSNEHCEVVPKSYNAVNDKHYGSYESTKLTKPYDTDLKAAVVYSKNDCKCKRSWSFGGKVIDGYCANPDGHTNDWCYIEPGSCSTTRSWDNCYDMPGVDPVDHQPEHLSSSGCRCVGTSALTDRKSFCGFWDANAKPWCVVDPSTCDFPQAGRGTGLKWDWCPWKSVNGITNNYMRSGLDNTTNELADDCSGESCYRGPVYYRNNTRIETESFPTTCDLAEIHVNATEQRRLYPLGNHETARGGRVNGLQCDTSGKCDCKGCQEFGLSLLRTTHPQGQTIWKDKYDCTNETVVVKCQPGPMKHMGRTGNTCDDPIDDPYDRKANWCYVEDRTANFGNGYWAFCDSNLTTLLAENFTDPLLYKEETLECTLKCATGKEHDCHSEDYICWSKMMTEKQSPFNYSQEVNQKCTANPKCGFQDYGRCFDTYQPYLSMLSEVREKAFGLARDGIQNDKDIERAGSLGVVCPRNHAGLCGEFSIRDIKFKPVNMSIEVFNAKQQCSKKHLMSIPHGADANTEIHKLGKYVGTISEEVKEEFMNLPCKSFKECDADISRGCYQVSHSADCVEDKMHEISCSIYEGQALEECIERANHECQISKWTQNIRQEAIQALSTLEQDHSTPDHLLHLAEERIQHTEGIKAITMDATEIMYDQLMSTHESWNHKLLIDRAHNYITTKCDPIVENAVTSGLFNDATGKWAFENSGNNSNEKSLSIISKRNYNECKKNAIDMVRILLNNVITIGGQQEQLVDMYAEKLQQSGWEIEGVIVASTKASASELLQLGISADFIYQDIQTNNNILNSIEKSKDNVEVFTTATIEQLVETYIRQSANNGSVVHPRNVLRIGNSNHKYAQRMTMQKPSICDEDAANVAGYTGVDSASVRQYIEHADGSPISCTSPASRRMMNADTPETSTSFMDRYTFVEMPNDACPPGARSTNNGTIASDVCWHAWMTLDYADGVENCSPMPTSMDTCSMTLCPNGLWVPDEKDCPDNKAIYAVSKTSDRLIHRYTTHCELEQPRSVSDSHCDHEQNNSVIHSNRSCSAIKQEYRDKSCCHAR